MEESLYRKFAEVEGRHWWFVARKRIVADVIRRMGLPKNARALDMGCGTGGILQMLGSQFEAYGTDTSELAVELCRQAKIEGAFHCDLAGFPHPGMQFDLVTVLDVIEHVDDDLGLLRQCIDKMRPGGMILVTVPAFQSLWSHHDEINHHRRRYRKKQLASVLAAAGFELRLLSYYNLFLFPAALAQRFKERWTRKPDAVLDLPAPWLNRTLTTIFASERFLLRHLTLPFGLSLIAVGRKPGADYLSNSSAI